MWPSASRSNVPATGLPLAASRMRVATLLESMRWLKRANPAIKLERFPCRLEDLPLGVLRATVMLACLHDRLSRLDQRYQAVVTSLEQLLQAVGLKAA